MKTYIYSSSTKTFTKSDEKWVVVAMYNPMTGVSYQAMNTTKANEYVSKSHGKLQKRIESKEFDTYKEALAEQKKMTANKWK
jgi:hypothetical protein